MFLFCIKIFLFSKKFKSTLNPILDKASHHLKYSQHYKLKWYLLLLNLK